MASFIVLTVPLLVDSSPALLHFYSKKMEDTAIGLRMLHVNHPVTLLLVDVVSFALTNDENRTEPLPG